jgi:O-antigen ligase
VAGQLATILPMQRFLHRLRGWPALAGQQAWTGALVLAFPLLSLVTGFGIGLAGFLFATTALAWRRDCWRLLRGYLPHTRWVLLAYLLQLLDIAWLAAGRGHDISDLDGPVRTCMAVAAMLVVQATRPPARWLWLGAAGGAFAALAFAAWQWLALGVERPGGLMNPITFGDLSLCLALLSLAGAVDGSAGAEAGRGLRSSLRRWIAAAGVACGLAASLLTGSRGGWLALLVLALLLVPLACRIGLLPRRLALALALLACALAAAACAIPRTGVRERVAFAVSDARLYLAHNPAPTPLSVRLELWKAGAMLVRERPWTGRDTPAYKQRMREWIAQGQLSPAVFAPPEPPHLHNDVLQVLVTRGLPGLLAWGGILVAPACFFLGQLGVGQLRAGKRRPAHLPTSPAQGSQRAAALAGAMVVLAYAGFGLTEVIFWSMKASLFYALMVFLLMGYCLNGQGEGAPSPALALAAGRAIPDKVPAVPASHPPRPATECARHRGAGVPRWRARLLRRTPGRRNWERWAGSRSTGRRRSGCGW